MKVIHDMFGKVAEVYDPNVRQAVCKFIIDVCNDCDSSYHAKLLQMLEKVFNLFII